MTSKRTYTNFNELAEYDHVHVCLIGTLSHEDRSKAFCHIYTHTHSLISAHSCTCMHMHTHSSIEHTMSYIHVQGAMDYNNYHKRNIKDAQIID